MRNERMNKKRQRRMNYLMNIILCLVALVSLTVCIFLLLKNYQLNFETTEALAQTEWETDRVLHLKIEELTQWLFGYRIPEAVKQYAGAEQIDVLSRIFLDEVV